MTEYLLRTCVLPKTTNNFSYICKPTSRIMNEQMDDKEVNDRLMAAEAMSALASLVLTKSAANTEPPQAAANAKPTRKKPARKKGKKGTRKFENTANKNNNNSSNFSVGVCDQNRIKVIPTGSAESKNSKHAKSKSRELPTIDNSLSASTAQISKTVTQCAGTQTGPSEEFVPTTSSMNLTHFHLLSSSLLPNSGFSLTSLPSIPSIDALRVLPSNVDLSAFPDINTVNLFLGGLLQQNNSHPSKETSSEGERSLPFKKRRYTNTNTINDASNGDNKLNESVTRSDHIPQFNHVSSSSESKFNIASNQKPAPDSLLKLNPVFGTQLMSEISIALQADEDGDLPLHIAVVHENLPMIKKFIQLMKLARKSVDKFNKQKQTPLHLAIKLNLLEAIKVLLDADADVNYVDQTGCSSLHLAVKHRFPHLVPLLFEHSKFKLEVNTRNFDGFSALHTAVELDDEQMINILLDKGVGIDIVDGKSGRTALYHAVESAKKNIVCLLLKRGANPEIQNYAGNTAIMAAQARSLREISSILTNSAQEIHNIYMDTNSNSVELSMADNMEVNEREDNSDISTFVSVVPAKQEASVGENAALPLDLHNSMKTKNIQVATTTSVIAEFLPSSNLFDDEPSSVLSVGDDDESTVEKADNNDQDTTVILPDNRNISTIRAVLMEDGLHRQTSNQVSNMVPEMLFSSVKMRTPVSVPVGMQSYINPQLKAKIQQNLKNKKIKAQLSVEKKD